MLTITDLLFQGLVYCQRSLFNNAILTKIVHGDMNVNHWECVLLIPILIQFGHQLRIQLIHKLIQLFQSILWIFFQSAYDQYQKLSFFLFSGGAISYISILDNLFVQLYRLMFWHETWFNSKKVMLLKMMICEE